MYTIKHAAQLTGLSPATLRAWEHRYGVVQPQRTESGYRLYDDHAIRLLTLMASLVEQGWSPQQAAEETRQRSTRPSASGPGVAGPSDSAVVGAAAGSRAGSPEPAQPAPEPTQAPAAPQDTATLIDAAARLDLTGLTTVLDERFSVTSFEAVVDDWLMPSLVALGDGWANGRVSVAGEHLASYAVMRRLAAAYDAAATAATGAPILVGLPPGSRHELGVLAFATAARRAGLRAAYVGADLPIEDWVSAASAHHARAVVLGALREADLPALSSTVEALRHAHPWLLIAVGGAQQAQAPARCLRLGHDIGEAAALLAATLGE